MDGDGEKNVAAAEAESLPPPYYSSPQHQADAAASADAAGWSASGWTSQPPAYSDDFKTPNESYPPYPTQYATPYAGQQQGNVVVVQPRMAGPLQNPPDDYMCYSIFVTVCCCWLVGIFAILRSSECRAAIAAGDRVTAEVRSREARSRAHLALSFGIGSVIFTFIFVGVYVAIVLNNSY